MNKHHVNQDLYYVCRHALAVPSLQQHERVIAESPQKAVLAWIDMHQEFFVPRASSDLDLFERILVSDGSCRYYFVGEVSHIEPLPSPEAAARGKTSFDSVEQRYHKARYVKVCGELHAAFVRATLISIQKPLTSPAMLV